MCWHNSGINTLYNCGAPSNLGHLLNNCKKSLERYRFRHDSVLSHIVQKVVENKETSMNVYGDLDWWKINGGTVPPELVATGQMPDIVLLDKQKKTDSASWTDCPFWQQCHIFQKCRRPENWPLWPVNLRLESLGIQGPKYASLGRGSSWYCGLLFHLIKNSPPIHYTL